MVQSKYANLRKPDGRSGKARSFAGMGLLFLFSRWTVARRRSDSLEGQRVITLQSNYQGYDLKPKDCE